MNKEDKKCEAKYGEGRCNKTATQAVISYGVVFNLCDECAKVARRQVKLNKQQ